MIDLVAYTALPAHARAQEARDARTRSLQQLADILSRGDEVTRVTTSLREMRRENNYGARMALTQMTPREHR